MADTAFASNFYTQLQADHQSLYSPLTPSVTDYVWLAALRERLELIKTTQDRIEFSSLVQDVAKTRKALIDAIPLLPLYDQRNAELVGGSPYLPLTIPSIEI